MNDSRSPWTSSRGPVNIVFLDAYDVCVPSKPEQVHLLEGMPEVALVCGALLY